MRSKFQALCAVVGCALAVGHVTPAASDDTPSRIVRQKRSAERALPDLEAGRNSFGGYVNPQVRSPSKRDSGRAQTLMFARNVNFRFVGNIGFAIRDMAVAIKPKVPSQPAVLDDPKSFDLQVLAGHILVSPAQLTALMNEHVFNSPDAILRNLKIKTLKHRLFLAGELKMGREWTPFSLEGGTRLDGQRLIFEPDMISTDNNPPVSLKGSSGSLEELLSLNIPGIKLVKSTMYMEPELLFPPPRLKLDIASASLDESGLSMAFTSQVEPTHPALPQASGSYMLLSGGDVKFLRVLAVNSLVEIIPADRGEQLDFSLYDYRKQMVAGDFGFRPNGAVIVRLNPPAGH